MKALVIGSSGFCGRHLVERLSQVPEARVVGVDLPAQPPGQDALARYISADFAQADVLRGIIGDTKPDWVFNLVALTGGDAEAVYRTNVLGTVGLLEAIRSESPNSRVLLVGSAAEYGMVPESANPIVEDYPCSPVGHYGVSKYSATLVARTYASQFGVRVLIMRPFNIVGAGVPESLVIGALLRRVREALERDEHVVKIGNLDSQRDFVAVEDVVEAYVRAIQSDTWGETFNICSGQPRRIRDVLEMALSHSPRPIELQVDPALFRPSDVPVICGSFAKANQAFGFVPATPLDTAIKAAWERAVG